MAKIRDVPDFPEPGIVFKDIMPLLGDEATFRETVDLLADWIEPRNLRAFRTAADRESSLLEAVLGPALRSRSAERRQAALGDLQRLAQSAQELADLLLRRNVRHLVE